MADQNSTSLAVVEHQPAPIRQHAGPRLGLPTPDELKALAEYGEIVVKSGMAPGHIKTWQAAVVVMRYGHQLGIDEFTALQNLFIVNGKPAAMASLLHTLILRDHGNDAIHIQASTATICALLCKRRGSSKVTEVNYTIEEARQAGLSGGNWGKYPADMLFARAVSRAGRQVFRDSTMGMYVPEEIGGTAIEIDGEVIDVESRETPVRETPARITGSTSPAARSRSRTDNSRLYESLRERARAAAVDKDQDAWKALVGEVGTDVVLWPALIGESPSETHLEWLEKAANGKGQQLRTYFDSRRGELAAQVEAGDTEPTVEVDPATGEVIPDHVGRS